MAWTVVLPEKTKTVEQDQLTVESDETYTVQGGRTEEYTSVDSSGTLDVQGAINTTGTTIEPYEERDLINVRTVDAKNRFAREAELRIFDPDKSKLASYPDYERVEIYYDGELNWGGFVLDQEWDDNETRIYALSHDFWLKKKTLVREFVETPVSNVLETIIKEDTPLQWDASLVDVGDDVEITQEYRGETVNAVVSDLAEASVDEEYGATDDRRFFFERPELTRSPTDFERGRYVRTDWEDESRREINRITLYYSDGSNSVTVDDRTKQRELADKINAANPVVEEAAISRPEIKSEQTAERRAQAALSKASPIQVGTVESWDVQSIEPGDIATVVDPANDIDEEYVVAEIEHNWVEAELLVAQNEKGVNDILATLSEDVDRIDLKEADKDADDQQIINIRGSRAIIDNDWSITTDGDTSDAARFTNIARNLVREGWAGQTPPDITEFAVGTDNSNISRSNTSLENEVERVSVSESLPDSTSVEYQASFSASNINEFGLFDSNNNLIIRAVTETQYDSPDAAVDLFITDDSELSKGVVTNSGLTAVRDIIANNTPKLPTQYAYGSDGTEPSTSDTALGAQVDVRNLDEIILQSVTSNADWSSVTEISDNTPLSVANDRLNLLKSNFLRDAWNEADRKDIGFVDGDQYNATEAATTGVNGNYVEFDVAFDYTIPTSRVGIKLRDETDTSGTISYQWDGVEFASNGAGNIDLSWHEIGSSGFYGAGSYQDVIGDDIIAGETYTFRVEWEDASGDYILDVISVYDTAYVYNFDNLDGTESYSYLNGPELYPDQEIAEFADVPTNRTITQGFVDQTWGDTSNNQFIQVSNDDGANWYPDDGTQNNTQSISATFPSSESGIRARSALSRYPMDSPQADLPRYGYNGQSIDTHELRANPDAITPSSIGVADTRAVIPAGDVTTPLQEGGQLASDDTLLTRSIFGEVDPSDGLISSERARFEGVFR